MGPKRLLRENDNNCRDAQTSHCCLNLVFSVWNPKKSIAATLDLYVHVQMWARKSSLPVIYSFIYLFGQDGWEKTNYVPHTSRHCCSFLIKFCALMYSTLSLTTRWNLTFESLWLAVSVCSHCLLVKHLLDNWCNHGDKVEDMFFFLCHMLQTQEEHKECFFL